MFQTADDQAHILTYHQTNKKLWYVCKCIPQLKGPTQQIKTAVVSNFVHQES